MDETAEPGTEKDDPTAVPTLDATDRPTLSRGGSTVPLGPEAVASVFTPGTQFGAYHLKRLLGQGAFGQVWEAETSTGRRVAVKVLSTARALREEDHRRFEREGRLAASVSHPNCVYVFGAEQIEGRPAIIMELVSGGTLSDILRREGPLPPRVAVDYALDILEGLAAANAQGVIHRDVKPSNCFLDENGRAKVGDFGLSRTLEVDSELTATGAFLGTPSYASPEQVKAEELDFRSDLYSLGATLYSLLTGRPPFEGTQLGQLVARILSQPPTPFEKHGVRVPPGLQRAVWRMMAKDRGRRFASFAAARAALLPFSSRGLGPASLARRFSAMVVDSLVTTPAAVLAMRSGDQIAATLVQVIYFLLIEKLWGHSLGKRLLGLRVVSVEGSDLTWRQAAVRTLLFMALYGLPIWPSLILSDDAFIRYSSSGLALPLSVVGIAVACSTMRRENGYAGVHERLSGTRVMALHEAVCAAAPQGRPLEAMRPFEAPQTLGAFLVEGEAWSTATAALQVARDPVLDRPVLVHRIEGSDAIPGPAALAEPGPGRLRWLQGSRGEREGRWDAYEAPPGASLLDWVARRGALDWDGIVRLLESVLDEIGRRSGSHEAYGPLSISRVWVDAQGRGRLLDFPVVPEAAADHEPSAWRVFVHQLVLFASTGRLVPLPVPGETPKRPLPEHARGAIVRLCGQSPAETPASLAEELRRSAARPGSLRRARRGAALAVSGSWLLFVGFIALLWLQVQAPMSAVLTLRGGLRKWERAGADAESGGASRAILEPVLADAYRRVRAAAAAQGSLASFQGQFATVPARSALTGLTASQRSLLETLSARHPSVDPEALGRAQRTAGLVPPDAARFSAIQYTVLALPAALIGLLSAVLARGGLSLFVGGIAVQNARGEPASRVRCLWRAVLAWLPALVLLAPPLLSVPLVPIVLASAAASLAGGIYALWCPARGLQDQLAGTWLVPR